MRDPQTDLEVCEKATRGPWEYLSETGYAGDYPYSKSHRVKIGNKTLTVSCHIYGWEGEKEERANASFIALAREALPWWINRAVELDAEVERLREALEHIAEYWNRNRDDGAMHDALWHIIETAEQALEGGGK